MPEVREGVATYHMARLVCGLAAHERLSRALDAVGEALEIRGEVLVLGASQRAADDFIRQAQTDGPGLLGVHRSTFAHLAADLAALPLAQAGFTRLSPLGAQALAARVVNQVRSQGPLHYFETAANAPGFALALSRTLQELRVGEVQAAEVNDGTPHGDDLHRLLMGYQAEMQNQGLADYAETLRVATEVATTNSHHLVGLPLVLLDAPPQHEAETKLLGALVRHAPDSFATVHARDAVGIAALQSSLRCDSEPLTEGTQTTLDSVRKHIFEAALPAPPPQDASMTFFSAPGEARECVEITRKILSLAAEGMAFDSIAVLLRHPQSYQPLLEDAFGRADIRGFFTRGATRPDPNGRALLALLACASQGLSASHFAEYMSLGQIPNLDEDGAPVGGPAPWVTTGEQVAPSDPIEHREMQVPLHWEKLLVDAAVIGGEDRWRRRLEGLGQELKLQLREINGDDDPRRSRKLADIEALENLQAFAMPLIGALHELPETATWGTWLDQLGALATLGVAQPEHLLAALAELRPMSDIGPVGLEEVQAVLTDRLSFLRPEPLGARFSQVFVGTLDEAAGRSFEAVFIPGLAEGVLPQKISEDPLLLDARRKDLSPGLSTRPERTAQERLRLHLGLGAATTKLFVSYPRMDVAQGRPTVPSFYALDLLRAAQGQVPDLGTLKKHAAETAASRLGWPAPENPADAIDETEYDLAVLGGLIRAQSPTFLGQGHYLVAAAQTDPPAEILVRGLRAQASKWRKAWSRADGLVLNPERTTELADAAPAMPALQPHRPSQRVYSATALQSFAACPYRFYLQAILRLRPRETPTALQTLDPLTRGSLFHSVQFELFNALKTRDLLPVGPDQLDDALQVLNEVCADVTELAQETLAPAIPAVWNREVAQLLMDLRGWLRAAARTETEWKPVHAELAFGLPKDLEARDPQSQEAPVQILGRFLVRGSVDLVEQHVSQDTLRVTDHKSGRSPEAPPSYVGGGEYLQPLIYGLAVQSMMDSNVESGRLYYCTYRGNFAAAEVPIDEDGVRYLGQVFETIETAVQEGFLPAAPRKKACQWCDFRAACGPDELHRVERKDPERLRSLLELRGAP